jgi:hypothetical protein
VTGSRRHPLSCAAALVASFAIGELAAGFAAGPAGAAQQGTPRVECKLERDRCFEGESLSYVVFVRDVDGGEPPDLSALRADFDVKDAGARNMNSSSIQIVNGRMVRDDQVGMEYHYSVTPKSVGRLKLPAPTVKAGARKLTGNELALEVLPPDAQDLALLRIDLAPASTYPLQPVTVKLRVFVKKLPAEAPGAGDADPIGPLCRNRQPLVPMLHVPWIDLPDGVSGASRDEWLDPLLTTRRGERGVGFGVNDLSLTGGPLFDDFFGSARVATFDMRGRAATDADVEGIAPLKGRADRWFVYELSRIVTPQRVGRFVFGPATLKGQFIDGFDARDRTLTVTHGPIFAVARAAELDVRDAPAEGRPPGYGGGFGRFEAKASVSPTRAHVGDPLTLTVEITGTGNLEGLAPPDLAALPVFSESFKVYEATAETKGGARHFTYSLRPLAASVKAVPPVPWSYFDVASEKYATLHTEALPIEVAEAEKLDPGAIVGRGAATPGERDLAARSEGLFTHDTDPRALGDERVDWRLPAATAVALPLATFAAAGLLGVVRRRGADPRARRRRGAPARARARIAAAEATARGEPLAAALELGGALRGLVADLSDLPEAGLTSREARDVAQRLGASDALAQRLQERLDALDTMQYGGGARLDDAALDEGRALLDALLREIGHA